MLKKFFTLRTSDGRIGKRQLLGRLIALAFVVKLALSLWTIGWLLFATVSDPLTVLPKPDTELVVATTPLPAPPGRNVEHVTLISQKLGIIGIVISRPQPLSAGRLPVLVVLGGLGTGETTVAAIPDPGAVIVVGYDWPIPTQLPAGWRLLASLPDFYHNALRVPAQVTSALGWVTAQSFADRERVGLLGFSLGALASPAVQDVAAVNGLPIRDTILAYGGAPLGALFAADPYIEPAFLRRLIGPVLDLLLRPLQPQLRLPRLRGRFLVMEGENDELVPNTLRLNLRNAVPEPKDIVIIPGPHMGAGPDKMQLLRLIIGTSRAWLAQQRAID